MSDSLFEPTETEIQQKMQEERDGGYFKDKTDDELRNWVIDTLRCNKEQNYKRAERKRQTQEDIETIVDKLVGHILNYSGTGSGLDETTEMFLKALTGEHRTLQQSFWRFIQMLAEKYAKLPNGRFDPRNEDAHEFTKKIAEIKDGLRLI